MKKLVLLIGFIAITCCVQATKRALVIGIGSYPESSGWNQINGDKDVPIVEAMLVSNGFQKSDIVKLINSQATATAIRQEMNTLIGKAQTGDIIYIHFSGHGQQVTDVHGDEEDGLDEAWIPYDACFAYSKGSYEGSNHIVDDQLNVWLTQLRKKIGAQGKITVVADACHSGGASRGDEPDLVVRGSADTFVIPHKPVAFTGEAGNAIDWIFISACKSYQCNYEYNGSGSLTYALSIQRSLTSTPCSDVQRAIRTTIASVIPYTQTPVVESKDQQQSLF